MLQLCFLEQIYPTENPLFRHIILPRILLFCGGGITAIGLIFALIETCSKSSCPVITDGILNIIGGNDLTAFCKGYIFLKTFSKYLRLNSS